MSYYNPTTGAYDGSIGTYTSTYADPHGIDEYRLRNYIRNEIASQVDAEMQKIAHINKISLYKDVIRFFNLPYGTAESILELCESSDETNQKMGFTMLLGSLKEQIKDEVIKEIFK